MNSGKAWVLGLVALGGAAGLFAATYWKRPENSVRWSFTQIHTSLVRGKRDAAARFLAPRITWNGKEMTPGVFLESYTLPPEPGEIDTAPCPSTGGHRTVVMGKLVYCFVEEGPLWKLHWIGAAPCACR